LTARARRLPVHKRLIKLAGRVTFWWLSRTASLLRPWSVRVFGNATGWLFFAASKRYRVVALRNLRAAFPVQSDREIDALAREVFRHFSREALQFFRLLSLGKEKIDAMVELVGKEHLDAALSKGKGCVVVTAHYGNFELLARKVVIQGYVANVIARDSDDPGITGITTRIRESGGYRVFDKDQPVIGAFRSLRNNEILGILPDQNESGGVFVDFFGRPAATATGPAVLSLRSGAPIVPAFCARVGDDAYSATVYPPIAFDPTGDEDKDVQELTALLTAAIEREVRRNPSQWLWLHDRWKLTSEAPNAAG